MILAIASIVGVIAVWYMVDSMQSSGESGMTPIIALRQPSKVGPGETFKVEVLAMSPNRWSENMIGVGLMGESSPVPIDRLATDVWTTTHFDVKYVDYDNNTFLNAGDYFLVTFHNISQSESVMFELLYKQPRYQDSGSSIIYQTIYVTKTG